MDLNKAMIIGNVTRDPESRNTPSGQTVCSFSIATNRKWRDKQTNELQSQPEFHNIVAWARLAETCSQYLKKGSRVYLEGRLQTRSWEDQTGVKKYRTEIVADNMIMLDRKGDAPATGGIAKNPAPDSDSGDGAQPEPPKEEEEIQVEDIPF
ncbi:MAG: single-stranded DNA-binding protein [Patescibacteria group bacterium]|jgi:single-strand DNA-binding protein